MEGSKGGAEVKSDAKPEPDSEQEISGSQDSVKSLPIVGDPEHLDKPRDAKKPEKEKGATAGTKEVLAAAAPAKVGSNFRVLDLGFHMFECWESFWMKPIEDTFEVTQCWYTPLKS